jgi:DNA-binding beta-propeller fold protein YncE
MSSIRSRPQPPPWHSYEAEKRGLPQPSPDRRGTVTPIDTATGTPGEPIDVGNGPLAIAITPDGMTVYVANTFDRSNGPGTVTPIATATNAPGPPIQVGSGPWAFAITPDSKTAYVINFYSDTVTPIDTATNAGPADPSRSGASGDRDRALIGHLDLRVVRSVARCAPAGLSRQSRR